MIKYCTKCGKEFKADSGYIKLCEECRKKGEQKRLENNLNRMQKRKDELKLRTTCLYARDVDLLKSIKDHKETLADAFHYILQKYVDTEKG